MFAAVTQLAINLVLAFAPLENSGNRRMMVVVFHNSPDPMSGAISIAQYKGKWEPLGPATLLRRWAPTYGSPLVCTPIVKSHVDVVCIRRRNVNASTHHVPRCPLHYTTT